MKHIPTQLHVFIFQPCYFIAKRVYNIVNTLNISIVLSDNVSFYTIYCRRLFLPDPFSDFITVCIFFLVFSALLLPNFSATGYCLSPFLIFRSFFHSRRALILFLLSPVHARFFRCAPHTLLPLFSSFLSRVFRHLERPALLQVFLRLCVHMVIPYTH